MSQEYYGAGNSQQWSNYPPQETNPYASQPLNQNYPSYTTQNQEYSQYQAPTTPTEQPTFSSNQPNSESYVQNTQFYTNQDTPNYAPQFPSGNQQTTESSAGPQYPDSNYGYTPPAQSSQSFQAGQPSNYGQPLAQAPPYDSAQPSNTDYQTQNASYGQQPDTYNYQQPQSQSTGYSQPSQYDSQPQQSGNYSQPAPQFGQPSQTPITYTQPTEPFAKSTGTEYTIPPPQSQHQQPGYGAPPSNQPYGQQPYQQPAQNSTQVPPGSYPPPNQQDYRYGQPPPTQSAVAPSGYASAPPSNIVAPMAGGPPPQSAASAPYHQASGPPSYNAPVQPPTYPQGSQPGMPAYNQGAPPAQYAQGAGAYSQPPNQPQAQSYQTYPNSAPPSQPVQSPYGGPAQPKGNAPPGAYPSQPGVHQQPPQQMDNMYGPPPPSQPQGYSQQPNWSGPPGQPSTGQPPYGQTGQQPPYGQTGQPPYGQQPSMDHYGPGSTRAGPVNDIPVGGGNSQWGAPSNHGVKRGYESGPGSDQMSSQSKYDHQLGADGPPAMDLATAANEVHNGVSEVVLLIPLDEVGMVMGKGGNVIKEMQRASLCKMNLQQNNEVAEGSRERGFFLNGTLPQLHEAQKLIFERLAEERKLIDERLGASDNFDLSRKKLLKWVIEASKCGRIIGTAGRIARQIFDDTGSHIQIGPESELPPGSGERVVFITGDDESNERARREVEARVGGRPPSADQLNLSPSGVKYPVPSRSVGAILGTGGNEIKRITQMSRARVKVSAETKLGVAERIVFIDGNPEQVEEARKLIDERVEAWRQQVMAEGEGPDCGKNEVCLKMAIPVALVGYLIGRSATNIKQISARHRVSCSVNQDETTYSTRVDTRPLIMNGKLENVLGAQEDVLVSLKCAPQHLKEQAMQPPVGVYPRGDRSMGGPPGHDQNQQMHNPYGMPPGPQGPGMGPPPGMQGPPGMPPGPGMPPPNTQGMQGPPQGPPGMGPPPMGAYDSQGMPMGMMGQEHQPMMMGGPPMMMFDQQGMPMMMMDGPPPMGMMMGMQPPPSGSGYDGIYSITPTPGGVELSVYPTVLTHIVGKGGSKIRELTNASGCMIKAQDRETVIPGQHDRKLHLAGDPVQVEKGIALVGQFIGELLDTYPEMRGGGPIRGRNNKF